jgi:hypothetical protein
MTYELCWAHNATALAEYLVPYGSLRLNGPHVRRYKCTLGVDCVLPIPGIGLRGSNELTIREAGVSNCNSTANITGWDTGPVLPNGTGTASLQSYVLGTATVGLATDYGICWRFVPGKRVQGGTLELYGPFVRPDALVCTLGVPCSVNVSGRGMLQGDQAIVVNGSCGERVINATIPTLYSKSTTGLSSSGDFARHVLGTAIEGTPHTRYRLCFASGLTDSAFLVPLGRVELHGPFIQTSYCTLGITCTVAITGIGLTSGNKMMVVEGGCNTTVSTAANLSEALYLTWTNPSSSVSGYALSANQTYAFGTPAVGVPGVQYSVCWSHDPDEVEYNVRVGTFDLAGPNTASPKLQCTLGLRCNMTVTGNRLNASNELVLLSYGRCGDKNATYTFPVGRVVKVTNGDADYLHLQEIAVYDETGENVALSGTPALSSVEGSFSWTPSASYLNDGSTGTTGTERYGMTQSETSDPGKYAMVTLAADTMVKKIVLTGVASSSGPIAARQNNMTVQLLDSSGAVVKEWTGVDASASAASYET